MKTETIVEHTGNKPPPLNVLRQFRVKKLSNNNVIDCEGNNVGKLIDMVVSYPSGRISFVVMTCGGFLGFGEVMFMVPWQHVELDIEKQEFILSITLERLKEAPSFDGSCWPDLHSKAWQENIQKFYENDSRQNSNNSPA